MARYTRSLSVALSLSNCLTQLKTVLEGCNLDVLFSKEDCLIARETPGRVPFAKLVTIEVLVDSTRATSNVTNMDVVVKNEELPLQTNNHCSQIFDQLNQSLNQHSGWQVIPEDLPSVEQQQLIASKPESPVSEVPTATSVSPIPHTEPVGQPAPSTPPTDLDLLPPVLAPIAISEPLATQTESGVRVDQSVESQQLEANSMESQEQSLNHQEAASQRDRDDTVNGDSINLESVDQKRVQTAESLEELRQKRAESVANLERLRQKRAESIANLEKIRQKRERMFAASERIDTPGEDLNQLDLPEQPSTS